ncbi:hypothetical protein MNBD_NITROSPINAE02-1439 [hydrothermal vent metagenome]|uniref:DUF3859 domain-containing protein n=1 Tax=hydrothermal vent metagenome TaxID=652676 RepID=A0A3B1CRE5_9ZZZZ
MGRLAGVLFLFFLAPAFVTAEAANVTGAKIVDFGLYSYDAVSPASRAHDATKVKGERLIKTTSKIEAKTGLTFGFRFMLYGSPSGEEVTLQFKGATPVLKNPDTGRETDREEWEFVTAIEGIAFVGYTFDHSWEISPGRWTFQVLSEGRPIATKTFTIMKR